MELVGLDASQIQKAVLFRRSVCLGRTCPLPSMFYSRLLSDFFLLLFMYSRRSDWFSGPQVDAWRENYVHW